MNVEKPLALVVLPGRYTICKLAADSTWPDWATGELVSVTRTADELSVVCAQDGVPPAVPCERGWRCLRIAGKLDFGTVGVLASLTVPLAVAGISIFVVSTFDTDYVLVQENCFERACRALRQAGLGVAEQVN